MRKHFLFAIILTHFCFSTEAQIIWNSQTNLAPSSSGNNHPRMVTDRSGDPMVTWYHASRVMFSKWNGTAFETPRILNPVSMTVAGASWMGPDIAAHGDTIYIVFKETPEDEGHIWIIRSFDGGVTFSDPVQVDFIGTHLSRFAIVTTDDSGNPIVGFMKFDAGFSKPRWVVTRSDDFGNTFSPDVLASGWSSSSSEVCDCCPGALVSSGNTVAMLYRDNKNHIRDTWVGVSTDGGLSFNSGMNLDRLNWNIHACPASGPDGVILGDTLYSTFMNGASGKVMAYMNRTALSETEPLPGVNVTTNNTDVFLQNFPRIAGHDQALGITWKQVTDGVEQILIRFTNNISGALPPTIDTVAENNIMNVDIAIHDGNIFIVWEDDGSGTLKFRSGTYSKDESVGFLDSTFTWTENHQGFWWSQSFKYTIDSKPAIFSGKTYYAVLRTEEEQSQQWGTEAYIRFEKNIVYRYFIPNEVELYNFNLTIGDTFQFGLPLVVDSIDTIVLLTGEARKRWKLRCPADDPETAIYTEWVEGIGNINGLFAENSMTNCSADGDESDIMCMYRNDTLLYDDPEIDGCWLLPTGIEKINKESIVISPNPALDFIDIIGMPEKIESINIFNAIGNLVYSGNNKRIDLHSFFMGYYYVVIHLDATQQITRGFVKY